MKNKISILYAVLVIAFASSCQRMLDEEIRSQVSNNHLSTPEGFEDGVKAAYSTLRTFHANEMGMTMTVFGTDTYTMGSDGAYKFVNEYTSQFDPRTGFVRDLWNNLYIGINACNTVIDRADRVEGLAEEVKIIRTAEARFLRAYYYFTLVQQFGPVHLATAETTEVTTEASRAPVPDIYAVIVDDLRTAIAQLPATTPDYGRATKPAAEHLLARVLLTRATSEAAEDTDYTEAAALAEQVITGYQFRLLDNFADVFVQGSGERNDEVIWAVQYTRNAITNGANSDADGTGNAAHRYFLMEYDVLPGMNRNVRDGQPWKRFMPTMYTLGYLFADRENDTRYRKSFVDVYLCTNPGTYTVDGKEVTYELGDTAVWLPGYELDPEVRAAKDFMVIEPSDYTQKLYPTLTKFLDPERPDMNYEFGSRDFLAFRLAETCLIAAEAFMYAGDPAKAAEYLNRVRGRAAYDGLDEAEDARRRAAMMVDPGDLSLDLILEERGRELLGEQLRWYDLVRTHTLVERVRAHNPDGGDNIRDFHVRRPIPQDQIDRTAGGAEAFPQNPGYN
ncbi:RagB/SusD family nutrient uptake outer membrane protein [Parapedobacter sp. ISTM3]|uniref:RagB/SusD family nutrient uptake outer membrane protein n=1 Tax=Parapedobacter sp. ISTM3 TaxID=2800130 RepID=UPI0019048886|nr:RagB/SusD family nutrient uptake outer membrane protein [Parapedobacter sp. ISTM3]MBK1442141.1 RagB/SusD family nutrient uptake outer membrane protein [Parapedobacter sp. ISTM3]